VLGRNSMTNILAAISVMALLVPSNSYAQATCASAPGPLQRVDAKIESWNLLSVAQHDCLRGVRVELTARKLAPGDSLPTASVDGPGQTAIFSLPIYCRRDDYMFLPPTTLGGLPCVSVPSSERVDPLEIALRMEAELPPPDLRIGMNPRKGMVAVPTWFWVEGYDGGVLAQSQTVLERHRVCHLTVDRDEASGMPVLGPDGRPAVHQQCAEDQTTFAIDVRLWPGRFAWDFGDRHGREIACRGLGDCGDALGQPFVDPAHPSPVQHPYVWSSLGANGERDAYTVRLGITFSAEYRVAVDGSSSGWRSLPQRQLGWSASHQVQEAQAVLTGP
jgi:hypothetical protein